MIYSKFLWLPFPKYISSYSKVEPLCDTVQLEIERRRSLGRVTSSTSIFSSRLVCADCGGHFGKKVWGSYKRNNAYLERHAQASKRIDELEAAKRERLSKVKIIEGFIRDIVNRPLVLTEFDDKLWLVVIDTVTVSRDGGVTFRFRNGTEITA